LTAVPVASVTVRSPLVGEASPVVDGDDALVVVGVLDVDSAVEVSGGVASLAVVAAAPAELVAVDVGSMSDESPQAASGSASSIIKVTIANRCNRVISS
jgi:hypothetical protein